MKLGDCIFCVIQEKGILPATAWKHPNNGTLRGQRGELNRLVPGDVVFIPDPRPKEVKEPTNQVHKFRMKDEKHRHWIEIELVGEDGRPVPDEKYRVVMPDGSLKEGKLDQNGWARVESDPPGECEVTFPERDKEAWEFIEAVASRTLSS
ncbi:MAG: hypothetical protein R2747_20195 [Pyrinomonadaceae bacterium]